jgi:hypothetical protein
MESDGVVSYSLPLCAGTQTGVENVHLSEEETPAKLVERGCEGSELEAGAQPGHMCLFTANRPGANENLHPGTDWKNAAFVQFDEPDGIMSTTSGTQGVRAVFATTGFSATGKGTIPAGGAYLVAGGPWAVRAK